MPTTPISVSTGIQGQTNTTLYTVPASRTAIVKAIIAQGATNASQAFTISKFTNGQNYPLNMNQATYNTPATGATQIAGANLISAPITLGAGDQIRAFTNSSSVYNFPSVASAGSQYASDGSTASINYIKYGNGIYMAVGSCTAGAFVSTSTDCITWTQKTSALGLTSNFNFIEYANGIWVAVKQSTSGAVFYSTDNGTTWAYATSAAGYSPTCLYSGNNTFVISTGTNVIYSTNGSTWTAATGLSAFLAQTGYGVNNVGWTGSHWIISNSYGSLATTNFTSWSGFSGTGFMEANTNVGWCNLEYSSYHGKYFATKNVSGVPNISSSSAGILWDRVATLAMALGKVAVAGANQVLLACPNTNSSARFKSTDGTTWTSGTDSQGATGKVWGLDNGYFLSFGAAGTAGCYLSTDPITGANTTTLASGATFSQATAAADSVSGKWVALGKNGTTWFVMGGSSVTNINVPITMSLTVDSTIGNPAAVTCGPDGYFYVVSDTGQVRRSSTWNGTWTLVNEGTIQQAYNGGVAYAIKTVGTTIYVFLGSNTTYSYYLWAGSTLNGGTTFTTFVQTGASSGAYWRPFWLGQSGIYSQDVQVATNGTYLFALTGPGYVTGLNPSVSPASWASPPSTTGSMQQAGGYTICYGAEYVNNSTTMVGWYYSTNIVTTPGTFIASGHNISVANIPPNRILYLGGIFYANGFGYGGMFSGTTLNILTSSVSVGSSIAGTKLVTPSSGFTSDGTNMVGSSSQLDFTMNTTTPSAFLYAATVTASVVEIS